MLPRKIKNLFRTDSFDDELRDIVREKYFILPPKGNSSKYKKWRVIYLSESKFYVKMVAKNSLFSSPEEYKIELKRAYNIDYDQLLLDFYKANSYSFLPEYLFETKNFLCFKYYNDYSPLYLDDCVESSVLKISQLLGLNLVPNELKLTNFFKDIVYNFHTLYKNEIIEHEILENTRKLLGLYSKSPLLNYLCFTPSNIALQDFSVKRDVDGKIVDWKYTNIDSWDILMPNYIFNIRGDNDDTHYNLQQIHNLYTSPSVILTYDSKYYNGGLIKDIVKPSYD